MSLKYDLIYEYEGELRIRTVIAASKDEVKKLAENQQQKTLWELRALASWQLLPAKSNLFVIRDYLFN